MELHKKASRTQPTPALTRFTKPATMLEEQVQLLIRRGMIFTNSDSAIERLRHVNYYRLGAYWLPYEADHDSHTFLEGTSFEDVWRHYEFDRQLRLLLLDAIERVEVSVRTHWAYFMAHHHGAHAHLDPSLGKSPHFWDRNLRHLHEEVERSAPDERFIQHHREKYAEDLPAVWVVCEVMSLGLLSKYYGNLAPSKTRNAIARSYLLDDRLFESWLRHLTTIRNRCAHHGRVWNREFTVLPMAPHNPQALRNNWHRDNRRIYNTLLLVGNFCERIVSNSNFKSTVNELIQKFEIDTKSMGFPDDVREVQ